MPRKRMVHKKTGESMVYRRKAKTKPRKARRTA